MAGTPSLRLTVNPNEGFTGTTGSFTVVGGSNNLVSVHVVGGFAGAPPSAASMSGGVGAGASIGSVPATGVGASAAAFRWVNVPAGTYTITFTGAPDSPVIHIIEVDGVDQTTPIDGVETGSNSGVGASTSHGENVVSATGYQPMGVLATFADPTPAGTQIGEHTGAYGNVYGASQYRAGANPVGMTWTTASAQMSAWVVYNVNDAGGGGGAAASMPPFNRARRLLTRI